MVDNQHQIKQPENISTETVQLPKAVGAEIGEIFTEAPQSTEVPTGEISTTAEVVNTPETNPASPSETVNNPPAHPAAEAEPSSTGDPLADPLDPVDNSPTGENIDPKTVASFRANYETNIAAGHFTRAEEEVMKEREQNR